MFHIPQTFDFDSQARRRKEKMLEEKIKKVKESMQVPKKTVNDLVDDQVAQQTKNTDLAKQIIDLLPEATAKQKAERKKNREDMKKSMFLPVQRPSPNTSELTDAEIGKARILRAGFHAHDSSMLEAQEYLDTHKTTRGWKIDRALSNADELVVTNGEEVKLAFRGTRWSNAQDAFTNTTNALQQDMMAPQNKRGSQVIKDIIEKYGVKPEILGYSKGGNTALVLGDIHELPATVFNPAIGPQQLRTTSKVPHTVINTVDDPISVGSYFKKKGNYNIKRIRSIQGENPISQHLLSNFTERSKNQPSGVEKLMFDTMSKSQNLAHVEKYSALRAGVESGKTLTETLTEFNDNNGQDVTPDGGLGERVHRNTPSVKYWLDAGGDFTPREEAHLRMQGIKPKLELPDEIKEHMKSVGLTDGDTVHPTQKQIMNSSPEARKAFVEQKRVEFKQAKTALDVKANVLHEQMKAQLKASMPTTEGVGAGLISGIAADKVIEAMDPNHKLGIIGDEAAKGGLAGGGAAAILGTAAAPEAIAGGAAWVAGSESSKEITKLTGSEAAGSVGGGAVGGGVAVATVSAISAGAEVAGAVAAGSELGAAFGSVVPGAGTAVGLALGAGIGAAVGGIGYAFSKIHIHW